MDTLTKIERSERMSRVKGRDTTPEFTVRRLVHGLGYRYRLHAHDLPGKPDIVFRSRRKVIFVHGCFWHRHANCSLARLPKSRPEFWIPKLEGNRERDARNMRALRAVGWKCITIWECELYDIARVGRRMRTFLTPIERGGTC